MNILDGGWLNFSDYFSIVNTKFRFATSACKNCTGPSEVDCRAATWTCVIICHFLFLQIDLGWFLWWKPFMRLNILYGFFLQALIIFFHKNHLDSEIRPLRRDVSIGENRFWKKVFLPQTLFPKNISAQCVIIKSWKPKSGKPKKRYHTFVSFGNNKSPSINQFLQMNFPASRVSREIPIKINQMEKESCR